MSSIGLILFYVVLIAGMWFLLMRPQKKEQKRVQAMLADMAIGDDRRLCASSNRNPCNDGSR